MVWMPGMPQPASQMVPLSLSARVYGAWSAAITWLHTHWFSGYNLPI